MAKRKICVVLANRANYGRAKPVLKAIKEHPLLELQLVVGSSMLLPRFGEAINVVQTDGFEVNARVNFVLEGQTPTTMAISTGLGIIELATVFENLTPDVLFVIADRYDVLSAAVAATYMNIPVAHLQGGEVSGSIDESVRHAITRLAHLHFPATELSAKRLIKMGEAPDTVHLVGCPSIDLVLETIHHPNGAEKVTNHIGNGFNLKQPYLLVVQHPVTTEYEAAAAQIKTTLQALYKLRMQTLMLTPNVDAGNNEMTTTICDFEQRHKLDFVHFSHNFTPEHYTYLLANTACIIGNSSSALREGSFLGTPAVNIGNRQAGRERGSNVMDVSYDCDKILSAVHRQLAHGCYKSQTIYGVGQTGQQVAQILATSNFRLQKRLHL